MAQTSVCAPFGCKKISAAQAKACATEPRRHNSCEKCGLGVCPTGNQSSGNLREKLLERAMNRRFRRYHREQSYLLAPSPSDWVAEGHLAYFIAEIVDTLEVESFYAR